MLHTRQYRRGDRMYCPMHFTEGLKLAVKYLNLAFSQEDFDALQAFKKASGMGWEDFVLACAKLYGEKKEAKA